MGNYNLSEADALFSLDEDEDFDYIVESLFNIPKIQHKIPCMFA